MATHKKENTVETLLHQAVREKAGLDIINALIDREREIRQEEARKDYYRDKLLLQSELPSIKKSQSVTVADKDGKIVSYHYASLEDILKVIKPYLKKYGFTYRWEFSGDEDAITCSCILTHIQGHSEVSTMTSAKDNSEDMNNIQSIGSTRTYLQRYTLGSILGLVFDDDNDGRTSKAKSTKSASKTDKQSIPAPKPKQKQEIETETENIEQNKEREK